jgi:hypothetical protein
MVRERLSGGTALVAALLLVGGLASRVSAPLPVALAAAPRSRAPADEQLDVAADNLEAVTARGGSGFTFTVVSRSTLHAKEGGPLIEVPDPGR